MMYVRTADRVARAVLGVRLRIKYVAMKLGVGMGRGEERVSEGGWLTNMTNFATSLY